MESKEKLVSSIESAVFDPKLGQDAGKWWVDFDHPIIERVKSMSIPHHRGPTILASILNKAVGQNDSVASLLDDLSGLGEVSDQNNNIFEVNNVDTLQIAGKAKEDVLSNMGEWVKPYPIALSVLGNVGINMTFGNDRSYASYDWDTGTHEVSIDVRSNAIYSQQIVRWMRARESDWMGADYDQIHALGIRRIVVHELGHVIDRFLVTHLDGYDYWASQYFGYSNVNHPIKFYPKETLVQQAFWVERFAGAFETMFAPRNSSEVELLARMRAEEIWFRISFLQKLDNPLLAAQVIFDGLYQVKNELSNISPRVKSLLVELSSLLSSSKGGSLFPFEEIEVESGLKRYWEQIENFWSVDYPVE